MGHLLHNQGRVEELRRTFMETDAYKKTLEEMNIMITIMNEKRMFFIMYIRNIILKRRKTKIQKIYRMLLFIFCLSV